MYRILVFLLLAACYACVPHKKIIYLQKTETMVKDTIERKDVEYKIQPKDRLYIRVTSYNKQVTEFFNLQYGMQGSQGGSMSGQGYALLNTYYVDESGYIKVPLLDSVAVAGFTVPEAQEILQKAVREQVEDALVVAVLANYQVTVTGEVGSEGIYLSSQNRLTIFDGLALAGGPGDFADRKHIKIVRKEGKNLKIGIIDITDRNVFNSEFYYLSPNDIVYVERLKIKTYLNNLTNISKVVGIAVGFILIARVLKPD